MKTILTEAAISEISANADDTSPYYLPSLLQSHEELRRQLVLALALNKPKAPQCTCECDPYNGPDSEQNWNVDRDCPAHGAPRCKATCTLDEGHFGDHCVIQPVGIGSETER